CKEIPPSILFYWTCYSLDDELLLELETMPNECFCYRRNTIALIGTNILFSTE
ncbi:uncharacterized protein CANTADRAFT_25436, partial [Suhomyces tanzawaensis NRRL Y-17324]